MRWTWLWYLPAVWLAWIALDWGIWQAVFRPDLTACQALDHQGACWGVVAAKLPDWVWGRYPDAERWRPALAMALWTLSLAGYLWPLWSRGPWRRWPWALATGLCWPLGAWLMSGQGLGLPVVPSNTWGGLPLTLMLTAGSLMLSAPLALALAWARQRGPRWLSTPALAFIEIMRGAPLVMWLFMGAFLLPATLPTHWDTSPVLRALLVITLFSAAYMAEIFRGSLAVVPGDQAEAARVLGASWWRIQQEVTLPTVFRGALPPLTSHVIGVIKDTSLVMVVSLHDLTGAMSVSLNGDADWRPFFLEAYLFIGAVYALMCLGVARLGRLMEARWPPMGAQH